MESSRLTTNPTDTASKETALFKHLLLSTMTEKTKVSNYALCDFKLKKKKRDNTDI